MQESVQSTRNSRKSLSKVKLDYKTPSNNYADLVSCAPAARPLQSGLDSVFAERQLADGVATLSSESLTQYKDRKTEVKEKRKAGGGKERKGMEIKKYEIMHNVVWRKLHNEELHNFHASSYVIRVIRPRRLIWAGNVASMGEMRHAYDVLVGKPGGKRPLGVTRHICGIILE
jgi:hypothetical protein